MGLPKQEVYIDIHYHTDETPELKIIVGEEDGKQQTAVKKTAVISKIAVFIKLARPKHWLKNSFVLAPFVCYPPAWQLQNAVHILITFACFCFFASSVYAFNDIIDRKKDSKHPRKCKRPIASGLIGPSFGIAFSVFLASTAVLLTYFAVSPSVCIAGLLYLANNLAYCLNLRNKVILDVMSIAAGFVLRIFAGCLAVAVMPSNWMLICGFSLALLLGFGKRRLELFHRDFNLRTEGKGLNELSYRKSLNSYPVEYVNILLGVSSMMTLMSYMLYTTDDKVTALHGSPYLIYTVPFVFYGVFRYAIRCIQGRGDGPVEVLSQDKSFIINAVLWAVCVAGIVIWK